MRWFVEVARVGDNAPAERYCIDAKAWQAALQETRKLRGDSGPLSKFSIELLDDGYRAVDPVQKIRYLVNLAPSDAPLVTPQMNGSHAQGPAAASFSSAAPSAPPASVAPSVPPTTFVEIPHSTSTRSPSRGGSAASTESGPSRGSVPAAPRPSPRRSSKAPGKRATADATPLMSQVAPDAIAAAVLAATLPIDPVTAPEGVEPLPPAPARPGLNTTPAMVLMPAKAADEVLPPAAPVLTLVEQPEPEAPRPNEVTSRGAATPDFQILTSRVQDPTPEAPITYRELAGAVSPGVSRETVERLLRERWAMLKEELQARPPGKLIQIAVFDHKFEQRPERPPLGTLTWKDWRGDAVLAYPAFGEPAPVLSGSLPPPAPNATLDEKQKHASAAASSAAASSAAASSAAASSSATPPGSREAQEEPEPVLLRRPPMGSDPARSSRSKLAIRRRRAGEDLISELFELMHELHFARDIAGGADFVMGVLDDLIPCELRMVQVFDINKRSFVVVRAKGAGLERALLNRTTDKDPLIAEIMRRGRSRVHRAERDARFTLGRWSFAEPAPAGEVLCGPVRQGGRYLGLIELSNPLGGAPFHETEINALDYICEQFAGFVASRPIVLDSDVILGR